MPTPGATIAAVLLLDTSGAIVGFLATEEHRRLDGIDPVPEWTYLEGESMETPYGPADWGESFAGCYGTMQSPINLAQAHHVRKNAGEFDLMFHPESCPATEVQFSPGDHSWMVGGACHDAEIYFVHVREGTTDDLLVVGVLMDASPYGINNKLMPLWNILDLGDEESDPNAEWEVSPYDLLPSGPEYSHYMGSLTTPPCTEGVKWIVMTDNPLLSIIQLEKFRVAMGAHHMMSHD